MHAHTKSDTKRSRSEAATRKATKDALAVTAANIARIETAERGEAPLKDGKPELENSSPAQVRTPSASRGRKKSSDAKPTKPVRSPKTKKATRLSGLDAAAKVLTESKEPMNAQAIITAMTNKGLWTSPGGKTPHATIYAAMVREIKDKGRNARFIKKERGLFAAKRQASSGSA